MAIPGAPQTPRWAEIPAGKVGTVEPDESLKDTGWDNGEAPGAPHHNWVLQNHARWVNFLRATTELNNVARLLNGGRVATPGIADINGVGSASRAGFSRSIVAVVGNDGGGNTAIAGSEDGGFQWVTPASGEPAGDLDLCAVRNGSGGSGHVLAFESSSGLWVDWSINGAGAATSGTIAGGPTVHHVFWDHINGFWWASTSTGLYRSPTSISWTQVDSSTNFQRACLLPSGRVVAYRSSDSTLYYVDSPHTSATAGAVLTAMSNNIAGLIALPSVIGTGVVAYNDDNGDYFRSADGESVDASASDYFGDGGAGGELLLVRGRLVLAKFGLPGVVNPTLVQHTFSDLAQTNLCQVSIAAQDLTFRASQGLAVARVVDFGAGPFTDIIVSETIPDYGADYSDAA